MFALFFSGYCTWFFDRIFGIEIGDICYDHDAAYDAGTVRLKIRGDWRFASDLFRRANRQAGWRRIAMFVTAAGMTAAVGTVGWGFWLRARWKDWQKRSGRGC